MFDPKQLAHDAAEAAPPNLTYGKLTITQVYKIFNGKGVAPTEVDRAAFDQADPRNRATDAVFKVDDSGFNTNQKFLYTRQVRVGGKDFRKTVLPSIVATFGALEKLQDGVWVEVQDIPQIDKEEFRVPKFLRVFGSKEECAAAWAARYQPNRNVSNGAVPSEIIETAQAMWTALSKNEVIFRTAVSQDSRLSPYGADTLLTAIQS